MKIIYILTAIIMIIGLIAGMRVITEERLIGVRRYAQSDLTPAFANTVISFLDVVPVFFMIGVGIYLQIKKKNPNMFDMYPLNWTNQ